MTYETGYARCRDEKVDKLVYTHIPFGYIVETENNIIRKRASTRHPTITLKLSMRIEWLKYIRELSNMTGVDTPGYL
tara:strand:+ start:2921 stop:3151 length:231 start_codon:yes stop_codon:yes gene_type:complete